MLSLPCQVRSNYWIKGSMWIGLGSTYLVNAKINLSVYHACKSSWPAVGFTMQSLILYLARVRRKQKINELTNRIYLRGHFWDGADQSALIKISCQAPSFLLGCITKGFLWKTQNHSRTHTWCVYHRKERWLCGRVVSIQPYTWVDTTSTMAFSIYLLLYSMFLFIIKIVHRI